jgi:mannose-1-phosphate guanylyltransferase/mannose-1-phosphate guanylyltransferase/mannose-6-phosphate isomerase
MIRPVILSGGAGTRLWPLSVAERPKQFHKLVGPESLLQATARRVADTHLFAPPLVIANGSHAAEVEAQLAEAGVAPAALILEPVGRNTAPAIALAALTAAPDELLLILPSDHVIADVCAFHAAVRTAASLAASGWLVTFGIRPDRPETGYGYIRRGGALGPGAFAAERFVEKPDRATAEAWLADGGYDWNGGIFLLRADRVLEELGRHGPAILAAAQASLAGARRDGLRIEPDEAGFSAAPAMSIDYAVMEKADRVAVVPVAMGWSDVGSWDALHELAAKDFAGNAVQGPAAAVDSRNCLIRSDGPAVIAIGVEDLIVVASGDAVIVVPRGESQRVKEALAAAARLGRADKDDIAAGNA